MVTNQLRTNTVSDAAVIAAMEAVPREDFVGSDQGAVAYRDTIVPLGGGRGLNPPIATGRLLAALQPRAGERALVVGAGTGYSAALLAALGCRVTALEESPELAARAEAALAGGTAAVVKGPLPIGWASGAPYDFILFDGAVDRFPEAIVDQLVEGGRVAGALIDRGVTRLAIGQRTAHGFGVTCFADVEVAALPGFAPAPAFTF
ncbi:MAG TPA: protein-L-isoaspartate O-methyltransferase [Sphingomonas sp.]